jgi:hypothetical protein
VDCLAAWKKQEGRPVASLKKQAPERLHETVRRTTTSPYCFLKLVSHVLTKEVEQYQWDEGLLSAQASRDVCELIPVGTCWGFALMCEVVLG